jgi:hypothetical protein
MTDNGSLPRLGSAEAPKAQPKIETIELKDRGVSIVLRAPRVETIVEFQEKTPAAADGKEENPREVHNVTVWLISEMLVDPEWGEDELKPEVADWTVSDWNEVQTKALALAGMGEEKLRDAQQEFQEPVER